jgi:hypothetical protein
MHSSGILHKAKGDQLHSEQKVLEIIRKGRLVLLSEAKSLKKLKEDYQARVHSYQMVLVIARQEASAC